MKLSNNIWFWVLQFVGWGTLFSFNTLFKLANTTHLNKTYTICEGLVLFGSALFASSLLRYYIKKNQLFESLKSKNIIKIVSAFLFATLLFSTLSIGLAFYIYPIFHDKEILLSTPIIISTFINALVYLFMWFVSYRIIKMTQRFRKNKEERLKLEATLKESELNTLKGQINPHFMFNSLNNIRGLMLEDVDKSREMITRLSDMLRYSLTQNKIDLITLKDEVEMVNNYIALSKIQFEGRLDYTANIEPNLLFQEIPPMIIQMLIENAIKHGISNLIEGGKINLDINSVDKQFIIRVSNSGQLNTTKNTTKVGLENIKKRLYLMYKNKATFNLTEGNKTVIATIKLPL